MNNKLEKLNAHYNELQEIINSLEEGKDYGKINEGGSKNCLFKSGAEKILIAFGVDVNYRYESTENDLEVVYEVEAHGYNQEGSKVGMGAGSYSTAETIEDWDIVSPKGQVKLKTAKILGRNTAMKMAQKRALVALALSSTGASKFFTQDTDDMKKVSDKHIAHVEEKVVNKIDENFKYALDKINAAKTEEELVKINNKIADWDKLDDMQIIVLRQEIDKRITSLKS